MPTFCRHNRFTADCPICSKGTVLEPGGQRTRRTPAAGGPRKRSAGEKGAAPAFRGPHVAGPARRDEDGALFLMRLERVPGGVRIGEWRGSALVPRAPVLPADELADLVARCDEVLQARDAAKLKAALGRPAGGIDAAAAAGVSRGRSGDFKEELRVEPLGDARLRVARWVLRPTIGWELQDAPPMLPAARYAEALAEAVRHGLIAAAPAPATPSP